MPQPGHRLGEMGDLGDAKQPAADLRQLFLVNAERFGHWNPRKLKWEGKLHRPDGGVGKNCVLSARQATIGNAGGRSNSICIS